MKYQKLLEAAVRAPSGDNCQPWRFEVADSEIRIYDRPERDSSLYNYQQRASLVAHGALLENLCIAASAEGYRSLVTTFPTIDNAQHVATVQLAETPPVAEPLYDAVFARTINRRRYTGKSLSPEQLSALTQAGSQVAGARLILLDKQTEKRQLAQVIGCNDRLVFENRNLHRFLFDHLRWNEQEARQHGDGLDVRSLELSLPDRLGMRFFKSYRLTHLLNHLGMSRIVRAKAVSLACSSAALGAIVVPAGNAVDYLNAGRLMERLWLEATRMGLSFHLTTGITFLMQSVAEGAQLNLSKKHAALLTRLREQTQSVCGVQGECIALFFRVGHSGPPRVRSLRLPLTEQVDLIA